MPLVLLLYKSGLQKIHLLNNRRRLLATTTHLQNVHELQG